MKLSVTGGKKVRGVTTGDYLELCDKTTGRIIALIPLNKDPHNKIDNAVNEQTAFEDAFYIADCINGLEE